MHVEAYLDARRSRWQVTLELQRWRWCVYRSLHWFGGRCRYRGITYCAGFVAVSFSWEER